jgi:hypothetical protein
MPDRSPQKSRSAPETGMHSRNNLRNGQRQMRRAKQPFSRAKKRKNQHNLQRVHEIIHDLNRRQIQTPYERHERAKRGRRPQHRKHAQRHAQRQAQRHFFRRHPLPQQFDNRPRNPPPKKSLVLEAIQLHTKVLVSIIFGNMVFSVASICRYDCARRGLRSCGVRPMLRVSEEATL